MFYGENPPQAAVLSYFVKNKPNDLKLKITDATGREVREITVPAAALRPASTSACWDLRVQPIPSPLPRRARRRPGTRRQLRTRRRSPFGTGAAALVAVAAAADSAAGAAATPGPFVLAGSYNVALVVDGKTVETKPLRVTGDPEVALTEAQRKQLYDMAMEMHELQKRTTEAASGLAALNRQITQLVDRHGEQDRRPRGRQGGVRVAQDRGGGDGAEAAGRGGRRRAAAAVAAGAAPPTPASSARSARPRTACRAACGRTR